MYLRFPGGVDYAMLVAVKKGWMTSDSEKKYNSIIQLWIRAPGCIIHSVLSYVNWEIGSNMLAAGAPIREPGTLFK